MIIRTWACLNRHCLHVFDGDGEHPPCVRCHGIRVKWVPRPVAILSDATKKADRTVAQLQSAYGDKNYVSPRRNERMAPKVNPIATPGKTISFEPKASPGWKTEVPLDQNGSPVAFCGPTGVTAKLPISKDKLGVRVPVDKRSASNTGAVPKYEARHQPSAGGARK